eukprot:3511302-Prorocentrum_lima.AAC.1
MVYPTTSLSLGCHGTIHGLRGRIVLCLKGPDRYCSNLVFLCASGRTPCGIFVWHSTPENGKAPRPHGQCASGGL